MESKKVQCPVCHGARTHVVQEEEKLCFLCSGDGVVSPKIVRAIQRHHKREAKA